MNGINNNKQKVESELFENIESYSYVEGFRINDSWKKEYDYPEPPDEIEIPTAESANMWSKYRDELKNFTIKMLNRSK